MAKIDLKFLDGMGSYIKVNAENTLDEFDAKACGNDIRIIITGYCIDTNEEFNVWLDKSTAIKFAKTLRTEINKIEESEVNNG